MADKPSNERELQQRAHRALEGAGYPLVETDAQLGTRGRRADLVVWGTQSTTSLLVPVAVVEVKKPGWERNPEATLGQLSAFCRLVGAETGLVFDGSWWATDPGFVRLERREGPPGAPRVTEVTIESGDVLARLLWAGFDHERGSAEFAEFVSGRSVRLLLDRLDGMQVEGDWVLLNASALGIGAGVDFARARRSDLLQAVMSVAQRSLQAGSSAGAGLILDDTLAQRVCTLLLLDRPRVVWLPNAGYGELVAAIAEQIGWSPETRVVAWCDSEVQADLVRLIGSLSSLNVDVRTSGSERWLGEREAQSVDLSSAPADPAPDVLVGVVPMDKGTNKGHGDREAALLDAWTRALASGGRAAVVTSRSLLERTSAARVRERLQRDVRVAAIIGLPGGVLSPTVHHAFRVSIVVLEKQPPGLTMVAELADDWAELLTLGGEFGTDYRMHLRR